MPYSITYRLVKGAPINSLEYDGSLHNLDERLLALEAMPVGRGIASTGLDGSGHYLVITYTDSTEAAPLLLPVVRYRSRGEWAPLTNYALDDTVFFNGAVYPVTFAHTSTGSFDPGATSGSGQDWYGEPLFESPSNVLPPGGEAGQVLTKLSGPDYLVGWDSPSGLPAGMFNGAFLAWQSGTALWRTAPITLMSFEIGLVELLFAATTYWRAPFAGRIVGFNVTSQAPLDVGGTMELKVEGIDIGLIVTIPDFMTVGAGLSSDFSGDDIGYHFNADYLLTLELVGFSESPPMESGGFLVTLRIIQD